MMQGTTLVSEYFTLLDDGIKIHRYFDSFSNALCAVAQHLPLIACHRPKKRNHE